MDAMMLAAIAALVVLLASAWWLVRRSWAARRADAASSASHGTTLSSAGQGAQIRAAEQLPIERPSRIVVAKGDEEVMSMSVLDEARLTTLTRHASKADAKAFSRALEPLMQIAPAMVTAAMAGSSQLMEVVVNGPLVAAADGNGLRAFTMGANGIQEHARLFEPSNLQNVANAAAIWQLASVVVAQKHLADISATLKRVESKVDGIQSFMEEQRLAVIQSVMHYLDDTRKALSRGEFLDRTRDKLEDFDIELERASMSLVSQIRRESEAALEHDTAGCEGEYTSALAKHRRIKQHVDELTLCNEVRLVNWYLCSLYPDRSEMLGSRLAQIRKATEQAEGLRVSLEKTMDADCLQIDAIFTSDETIAQRRREVRLMSAVAAFQESKTRCDQIVLRMGAVAADRKAPQRLIIESHDGKPSAVYLCHEQSAGIDLTMQRVKQRVPRQRPLH